MDVSGPKATWPPLNLPSDLLPKTEALSAKLGEMHSDVQFFRSILKASCIEETTLDRVTAFIASSKTLDAAQIAIDLSRDCIAAVALIASAQDILRRDRR